MRLTEKLDWKELIVEGYSLKLFYASYFVAVFTF
jgi:hypothetical protein